MVKFLLRFFLLTLVTLIIIIIFLSYFGLETDKFNDLIKNKANEEHEQVKLEFKETKIHLNLRELNLAVKLQNPKILILLGSTALNTLIGNEVVISKARGKWIERKIGEINVWVIASFHPAFLMRQPEQKKLAWIDLKMVREKSKILKI